MLLFISLCRTFLSSFSDSFLTLLCFVPHCKELCIPWFLLGRSGQSGVLADRWTEGEGGEKLGYFPPSISALGNVSLSDCISCAFISCQMASYTFHNCSSCWGSSSHQMSLHAGFLHNLLCCPFTHRGGSSFLMFLISGMPYHPLWASQFFYHLYKIFLVLSSLCWNYLERFFLSLAGPWLIHHLKIVSVFFGVFFFFPVFKIFICSSFIATCFCLLILNTFILKSFQIVLLFLLYFMWLLICWLPFVASGFIAAFIIFGFWMLIFMGTSFPLQLIVLGKWFYDCFVRTKWLRAFAPQACHCSKSGAHTKYVLGGWLCKPFCFLALLQASSLFLAPLPSRYVELVRSSDIAGGAWAQCIGFFTGNGGVIIPYSLIGVER